MKETFEEFKEKILKKRSKRQGKVSGSYGVYDAYKSIRKNKWYDIGRPLTEHEFYTIIRSINLLLADELSKGNEIVFPYRMGSLDLRMSRRGAKIKDGKLVVNYPIDWNSTLKLWYNDAEAMKNKILVRAENSIVFHFIYNKYKAVYNNKSYYQFIVNRAIKQKLRDHIIEGTADTLFDEY